MVSVYEHQDINNECWRSISGYKNYQVSNIGRVRNAKDGRILIPIVSKSGDLFVEVCKHKATTTHHIHVLVANEWLPNPDERTRVEHMDHNKINNQITNLRWISKREHKRNNRNTSEYMGVSFNKASNNWQAHIKEGHDNVCIGFFETAKQAARAYDERAGEIGYRYINDIPDSDDEEILDYNSDDDTTS